VVRDSANLPARLKALAETVVVPGSSCRLVGDLFKRRDLGRHEVRELPSR
jgi:hypothetical protein